MIDDFTVVIKTDRHFSSLTVLSVFSECPLCTDHVYVDHAV